MFQGNPQLKFERNPHNRLGDNSFYVKTTDDRWTRPSYYLISSADKDKQS